MVLTKEIVFFTKSEDATKTVDCIPLEEVKSIEQTLDSANEKNKISTIVVQNRTLTDSISIRGITLPRHTQYHDNIMLTNER